MSHYLTYKQVAARCGVHMTTIYRWRATQGFPEPVKLGPASTRFKSDEVDSWLFLREGERT
jgi:prophage regulatory protein